MTETETGALDAEDAKLIVLARGARARAGAAEGAAVRDEDGRTYAAATVDLPALRVSAVGGCVVMAASSGAKGLEAAVVLTGREGRFDLAHDARAGAPPLHAGLSPDQILAHFGAH